MTQDEAIRRTSILLQRLFRDDLDTCASIVVAEAGKDIDLFASALDQLERTCVELKQGLWNK